MLARGIVFIDLAIAQVAGLGVIAASSFGLPIEGWGAQAAAGAAALAGALLLTWTERKRPEVQEALIGILFVLASTAQILLLANDPHGGENLKDLLAGQILWVSTEQLIRAAVLTACSLSSGSAGARDRSHRLLRAVRRRRHGVRTAGRRVSGVHEPDRAGGCDVPACAEPATRVRLRARVRQLCRGARGSVVTDLPSSPVIVWAMGILGLLVHLTGKHRAQIESSATLQAPPHRFVQ